MSTTDTRPGAEHAGAPAVTCHVLTHVHWDREWYRPFEAFRARLAELAERVCDELDDGRMASFHLDGQTIVLSDVQALRPDLAARLRAHARAGRLTLGPWHVLADNQLVSGENLIRNLLTARRWGATAAGLSSVGYCPDTFGHPADLPRILTGFGMDTALVWRGAPDGTARFRWRSPDGSEVFAVNQGYHAAEVLWPEPDGAQGRVLRLREFARTERARLPGGPWLLMNGGDHLAPSDPVGALRDLAGVAADERMTLRHSTLEEFFAAARAGGEDGLPLVEGALRHRPGRLTFILPGTLSARAYLKQANAEAQMLLEQRAEPLVALHAPDDPALAADLGHAWELLLRNSPHDSICGCSVDEVHRENVTRFERVREAAGHVVLRALAAAGLDTRQYGAPAERELRFAVLNPRPQEAGGPVTVEVLTAPGTHPAAVLDPDGTEIPFESVPLGPETAFEADIDLMPDSRPALRHRLALIAHGVPALGHAVHTVRLADGPAEAALPHPEPDARVLPLAGGATLTAADDASLTLRLPDGTELPGLGRLVDEGDRGDTYNFDPVPGDTPVTAVLRSVRRHTSPVRTRLELGAELTLPRGLNTGRDARSTEVATVPVRITVTAWRDPAAPLEWDIRFDNTADDHRLRLHFPTPSPTGTWTADTHFSLLDHPVGPDMGPLPSEPAHEAEYGAVPVQTVSALGEGAGRVAVAAAGLHERTGLGAPHTATGSEELAVTLLRSVGWLSRFDLAARTTGAGPMLATPEAQCRGPQHFRLLVCAGRQAEGDAGLVRLATAVKAPLYAVPLRPGTAPVPRSPQPFTVAGAPITALKPAEDGQGLILRVSNPTREAVTVRLALAPGTTARPVRLDESALPHAEPVGSELRLAPYALETLRLLPPPVSG
ncbi:glycosyl hydrolase-related protein [Streptomyces sp. NPDC020983]|uniref:glycoside hydrolase family 38 N-terminal domain-containing protein n=1 Tax=Streptomyces sp. NPDC020983 TaxID=3365106 RepID=UPI0037976494